MLKTGILNPQINSLLSRVRHTNTLVIADRGFPFWPMIETIDISLVDGIPTVLDVLRAIRANFVVGKAWMAEEFLKNNTEEVRQAFARGAVGHSADARAARRFQEAGAAGDRPDPHGRHGAVCEHGAGIGVTKKIGKKDVGKKYGKREERTLIEANNHNLNPLSFSISAN